MKYALAIFAIFLTLILVIGLHEAGHAIIARFFNVKIKRISIGFGRPLLKWRGKTNIEWVWALWPLGGYVYLLNSRIEPVTKKDRPFCFDKKPITCRLLILAAGVVMNLVVAWGAFWGVFCIGYQQITPVIQAVQPKSIAAQANLNAHDRVLKIAGQPTPSWKIVGMELIVHMGQSKVSITTQSKKGVAKQTFLDLSQWQYQPQKNALLAGLGIGPDTTIKPHWVAGLSPVAAMVQAGKQLIYLFDFFIHLLKQLILGHIPFAVLLGPVAMFSVMIESFMQGFVSYLMFLGSLSVAVAVINSLPFPGLDGGGVLYTFYEKLVGRPVSIAMEVLLYRLAMIAFAVFLVQLFANDIQHFS